MASSGDTKKKPFTFKKRPTPAVIVVDSEDDEDDFKPSKSNPFPSKVNNNVSWNSQKTQVEMKQVPEKIHPCLEADADPSGSSSSGCAGASGVDQGKDKMKREGSELEEGRSGGCRRNALSSSDQENLDEVTFLHEMNNDGKAAWKNLMGQMQKNQKDALQNSRNKTSSKRGLVNSPKAKKDVVSKAAPSPSRKNPRLGTGPVKQQFCTAAVVKKLEQEFEIVDEDVHTADQQHSQIKKKVEEKTKELKALAKIAPIFLPPAERKALQCFKPSVSTAHESELLGSIIDSVTHFFNQSPENPDHFNGNCVILNNGQPSQDVDKKTKTCPFYKKLPGVPFCVDAFNYGVIPGMEVYFLSHFHSDHYIGLTKKFYKTIICSYPTGNLVRMKLYVEEKCIRKLHMNKPYIICEAEVTLIDANHCPGSVLFIFRFKNGQSILHTGDFRYTPDMLKSPFVAGMKFDSLYLDTTYCSPQYDFPTQAESILTAIKHIKRHLEYRPKTLILCGSYLIGKERVYFTIAEAVGSKVFGNYDKRKTINALENPKFSSLLTADESSAVVHVVPMFSISFKNLHECLVQRPQYSNIIGVRPSGWQFSSSGSGCTVKSQYNDAVTILGVPYSEHSSFSELKEFVTALKPRKVQPTVNVGNAKKRGEMMQHIESWLSS